MDVLDINIGYPGNQEAGVADHAWHAKDELQDRLCRDDDDSFIYFQSFSHAEQVNNDI